MIFEYEFNFLSMKECKLLKNYYVHSLCALKFDQVEVKEGIYNVTVLFSEEQKFRFKK